MGVSRFNEQRLRCSSASPNSMQAVGADDKSTSRLHEPHLRDLRSPPPLVTLGGSRIATRTTAVAALVKARILNS